LRDILLKSIAQVSSSAKKKNITIEKSIKELRVFGKKEQLTQLFTIFLDNAVKYSYKKSKIKITALAQGSYVEVSIKDQGIGISKENQEHIFERFYRADRSRSHTDTEGYGLGLAIAKEIIETHGGMVSVQSQLKKGSNFIIKLPLKYRSNLD
jgi:signal transduction histidine kinase